MSAALLLVSVLVAAVALALLAKRSHADRAWSDDEYERRRRARGSGLLAASMKALAEEVDPGGKRAAEERAALERGAYQEREHADGEPPAAR